MEKRILVVDDEKAIRRSFELTFENSDFILDTATNGEEGIEKITKNYYDLIFLDLKMPKMNGVQLLEKMNQIGRKPIVYFITAFRQEFFSQLVEARNKGYNFEVLQKPLNSEELNKLVNFILDEHSIG